MKAGFVSFVGRPNAGKSTLINQFLGQDRLLTGPEAGITRDSIAVDFDWKGRKIKLFDTAGLRRKARVQEKLEKLSVADALRAIRFAEDNAMGSLSQLALAHSIVGRTAEPTDERLAAARGLPGGDPTARPDLIEIIERLARIDGISDLAMTTNGLSLASYANEYATAGLGRVNVSLDSLNPTRFAQMTGVDALGPGDALLIAGKGHETGQIDEAVEVVDAFKC